MHYREISKCRICGNPNLIPIINLGNMSLTGVFPKPGEIVASYPIEMVKCAGTAPDVFCGLLQLRHSYDSAELYGDNYGYRSGLNSSMVRHLQAIVEDVEKKKILQGGDLVIDIASNDGTLLSAYNETLRLNLWGIDPTAEKFKIYYPERVRYIADFFSADVAQKYIGTKARVITSIAMFYDLEDPIDFARQIYDTLTDDGIWIFEQSYMPAMIQNVSYDTICHEHLEYYGLTQIEWLLKKAGLKIIDVAFNDANGGSFRVTAAKQDSVHQESVVLVKEILMREKNEGFLEMQVYEEFRTRVERHREELLDRINTLRAQGKTIFGYGASTKGNVILQFCGLTTVEIPYIAEVNEYKFGRMTPGTSIPIISETQAREMNPDYFLVLPWHFREHIIARESAYLNNGGHLFFPLPKLEIV